MVSALSNIIQKLVSSMYSIVWVDFSITHLRSDGWEKSVTTYKNESYQFLSDSVSFFHKQPQ